MRTFFALILTLFLIFPALGQQQENLGPVKWMDIQTAWQKYKQQRKPMLIDVYTDWCKWCKVMMARTYSNQTLAQYINRNFYPVRFNAETGDTISFIDKKWVKQGRVNQLASFLLNGRLAYPSTVFIDIQGRKYVIPGYLQIRDIEPLLVYFAENISGQNVQIDSFRVAYMYSQPQRYKDELAKQSKIKFDTTGRVNWLSLDKVYSLEKKHPRLIMVFSYVPWCYSCKVMQAVTFRDKQVAEYINQHFYPVSFNAVSSDTIRFGKKVYIGQGQGKAHQLAMLLFNRQFFFPAIIFLDKDLNLVGRTYGFYFPNTIISGLKYFGSGYYKKGSYQQFVKKH